jgi:hypothetical protein
MESLTLEILCSEAEKFSIIESQYEESSLYGVTDGKALGTYLEHKFKTYLQKKYLFIEGSSASGINFPDLLVDMKVTSIKQPQSSCPFKSARQKIFGLGYSLIIFVYDKIDNSINRTAILNIQRTIYVNSNSFYSWKIAICGLYKKLEFRLIYLIDNKPVMFDDTVYFLSFHNQEIAEKMFIFLTSSDVIDFYSSLIFWDEKRPIKSSILNCLNIEHI